MCQKYKKVQQNHQHWEKWQKYRKNTVNWQLHKKQKESGKNKSQMSNTDKKEVNWVHLHTKKVCASTSGTHANISETRCQNEHTWCWTTEHWTIEYWTTEYWTIELALALHSDNKKEKKKKKREEQSTVNKLDVPTWKDQILINKVYDPPCDQWKLKWLKSMYKTTT